MQEKVLKIIEDLIQKPVNLDDQLLASGLLDSITGVDLILAIQAEFDVEIPIIDAEEILASVKSLLEFIEQNA